MFDNPGQHRGLDKLDCDFVHAQRCRQHDYFGYTADGLETAEVVYESWDSGAMMLTDLAASPVECHDGRHVSDQDLPLVNRNDGGRGRPERKHDLRPGIHEFVPRTVARAT